MDSNIPPVSKLLDFTGKVAVVTGSGSGLGQGIAQRFAEAGADVVVHYQTSREGAEQVVKTIQAQGRRAVALQANLIEPEQAASLIKATVSAFGRVDVLVNNAGIFPLASVLDMTPDQWDEVVDANLRTAFLCTQAFARQIVEQNKQPNANTRGGAIVNITSIEAENPAPLHSHYDAAKGGVTMLTRASAFELAEHGIRVNAVAPGLIWRQGIEQAWPEGVSRFLKTAPLKRLGMPEDVADACLFLASPGARWITGASLTLDGGVMTHQIF